MSLFTEEVTLRTRGGETGRDELGRPVYGPPSDETWPAWYEPRESDEAEDARDQQIWGYWVYLPKGAPLGAVDAVVIEGTEYEVEGEPGRWPGGFVLEGYVKAAVGKVTG